MPSATAARSPRPNVSLVEGTALDATVVDDGIGATSLCRLPNGQDTDNANADWKKCSAITVGVANLP